MKLTVIGIGRLGLCTALCFEKGGHKVCGVDIRQNHVKALNDKSFKSPEKHVNDYLASSKDIYYTSDLCEGLEFSDIYFIVVDTPNGGGRNFYDHGKLGRLLSAINDIGVSNKHIVICCTVMPGYINNVASTLISNCQNTTLNYNPEFIAQGNIIEDFLRPDMMLIGAETDESKDAIVRVYKSTVLNEPVWNCMRVTEAEITKISVNGFITTKIAYANTIGDLCVEMNVRPDVVLSAVGSDTRIGNKYFKYGDSFGGPCFPRDTHALAHVLEQNGVHNSLIIATHQSNEDHIQAALMRINIDESPIIIRGLSYKPVQKVPIIEESHNVKVAVRLVESGFNVVLEDTKELIDLVRLEYGNMFTYRVEE